MKTRRFTIASRILGAGHVLLAALASFLGRFFRVVGQNAPRSLNYRKKCRYHDNRARFPPFSHLALPLFPRLRSSPLASTSLDRRLSGEINIAEINNRSLTLFCIKKSPKVWSVLKKTTKPARGESVVSRNSVAEQKRGTGVRQVIVALEERNGRFPPCPRPREIALPRGSFTRLHCRAY